eukprot:87968-Pleurochrysis_carterae.AAC.1
MIWQNWSSPSSSSIATISPSDHERWLVEIIDTNQHGILPCSALACLRSRLTRIVKYRESEEVVARRLLESCGGRGVPEDAIRVREPVGEDVFPGVGPGAEVGDDPPRMECHSVRLPI